LTEETQLTDRPGSMSIRTFQRDIREIYELFRVHIAYDFSRKVYYIDEDSGSDMNTRLLESLDTINSLRMAADIGKFMYFEKRRASGTQHFHGLIHAIRQHIVLSLTHQKFDQDEPTQRSVAPYALKESRGRWYLVALDRADRRIKTFGLDRILEFNYTSGRFDYPAGFDVNSHFRHCFGVIRPDDAVPKEVILSFDPEQGKYINSYPLHESQQILVENDQELRIRLYLYTTYDLIQELMSYGDRVKVLEPADLKIIIISTAGKMAGIGL
jgi:predicted DNA-binding transcriptional regulator YafY